MAIVVKQNQIQTISVNDSQNNANTNAQSILQAIVGLFASVDGWSVSEEVNTFIETTANYYPNIYTAMLRNSNTNEYMRLWFATHYMYSSFYTVNSCFYITDSDRDSLYNQVYLHKNNVFRSYQPSSSVKYQAYNIYNVICGISDSEIDKDLGHDLGLKLPLFELFYNIDSPSAYKADCSLTTEGGPSQSGFSFAPNSGSYSLKTLKFTIIGDDADSKFVFIANANGNLQRILRWSAYNKEFVTPENENDQYLQGAVFNSYPDTKQRAVFRAVDGSVQFGQYDTVLDGVALPAGAASDEGIVASPLFLSSQLESAGLDVPNVDNGSGYKGQIKTDWLLVSNSQVVGTTHNQGTWLNVGGGILVPWSPDAGSPFIS